MSADHDVVIIGAGPSGAIAAALLIKRGYHPLVLERAQFPRFSIGESLLPQCMEFIEEAGMLDAVRAAAPECGFQYKDGAAFDWGELHESFHFEDKFSPGHGTTYQVRRAEFDKVLADEAAAAGADIRYRHEIVDVDFGGDQPRVTARDLNDDSLHSWTCSFVLDASGFARVLPRLLDLDRPSDFPVRQAIFTHVEDRIASDDFDRDKILITVHPDHYHVWFWLIPFSDGRSSLGVVASQEFLDGVPGEPKDKLRKLVADCPDLSRHLAQAEYDTPASHITGYSANVKSLWGPGYALLGNAGEFLDPVFSSGVTVAMKSASLAADTLGRQLSGEAVDWQKDFAEPLQQGVDTFRTYVEAWYEGTFQDVIFHEEKPAEIKAQICSILAGYAWDTDNPYVRESRRRLKVLASVCQRV
ncbi:NAD(P)/FAD-dependent oxidoreductase [Halofilum ochraceum]|uniref:NAD(P)/FAD-dependent oxidoreductase n=1 Tax=Halofilum ochraceum TaxID=1611323 RepID=UPI00083090FC|nr:NAD(P)/FAD-dependent oxidoreductase [Halofilum ochraceum]